MLLLNSSSSPTPFRKTLSTLPTLPMSPGLPPPPPPPPQAPAFHFPPTTITAQPFTPTPITHPHQKIKAPLLTNRNNQNEYARNQKPLTFSKWNRKITQQAIADGHLLSIYVENIPMVWTIADILSTLSVYGEIIDVYIPGKKSRNGKRFGFIRFKKVQNHSRIIEGISSIPTPEGKLRGSYAREIGYAPTSQPSKNPAITHVNRTMQGKSYAQTVKKQDDASSLRVKPVCNGTANVFFCPLDETMNWLNCCAYGVLSSPIERDVVQEIFISNGIHDAVVSELGGEAVLVHFQSQDAKRSFLSSLPMWIEDHFQVFREWMQGDGAPNRKCWIQLKGVPLQTWCRNFFMSICRRFGDLIKIAEITEEKLNLEYAFIQVLTSVNSPISWDFNVDIKGLKQVIKCTEIHESCIPKVLSIKKNQVLKDLISLDSSPQSGSKGPRKGKSSATILAVGSEPSSLGKLAEAEERDALGTDPFHLMDVIARLNEPIGVQSTAGSKRMNQSQGEFSKRTAGPSKSATPPLFQDAIPLHNKFSCLAPEEVGESSPGTKSVGYTDGSEHGSTNQSYPLQVVPGTASSPRSPSKPISLGPMPTSPVSVAFPHQSLSELIQKKVAIALNERKIMKKRKVKTFNKLTGSIISTGSLDDSTLRRVNRRLMVQDLAQVEQPILVPDYDAEANLTIQVGNQLCWEDCDRNQELRLAVRELIEKEGEEWLRNNDKE
ncbi:hypothetical protein Tsubulata_038956 [Turnera subulata]|uniref:RRM domain-containing protein n=1 Tax=Turnera subulata TaxID=218843 RepID=A0A9Q0JEY2_9ROSI|nr:hypothetical protein Tsubulata_038956 [Turnera subulata]